MPTDICNTCLFFWDLSRNECASWLQAWGSIAAIVASVLLVNRSHKLQTLQRRKEAYDSYTEFLEVVFQLLGAARQIANKIYQMELAGNVTPGEYKMMKVELATLDDAMGRIPMDRLDRYEFIEGWLVGHMHVRFLLEGVEYFTLPSTSKQLEQHYVRNIANQARDGCDGGAKRIEQAIHARKGADVK